MTVYAIYAVKTDGQSILKFPLYSTEEKANKGIDEMLKLNYTYEVRPINVL